MYTATWDKVRNLARVCVCVRVTIACVDVSTRAGLVAVATTFALAATFRRVDVVVRQFGHLFRGAAHASPLDAARVNSSLNQSRVYVLKRQRGCRYIGYDSNKHQCRPSDDVDDIICCQFYVATTVTSADTYVCCGIYEMSIGCSLEVVSASESVHTHVYLTNPQLFSSTFIMNNPV